MALELDERVRDEIEALEAILMEDVTIQNNEGGVPECIKTVVFPSTADDAKQQYVCVTLEVFLTPGYPDNEPEIKLKNPRGLDDGIIDQINQEARDKCIECLGQPVVFELIELIREKLTQSNVPSCQCAVCLYGFKQGDQFTKTECYHYFHAYCLACHLVNTERLYREEQEKLPAWQKTNARFQPICPVCREAISCELESLRTAAPPVDVENARQFEATAELRALQAQMAALYLYQQSRGGIIDVEAEESKLLLVTGDGTPTPDDEPISDNAQTPPGPSLSQTTQSPQTQARSSSNNASSGQPHSQQRVYRGFNRNGRRGRGRNSRQHSNR